MREGTKRQFFNSRGKLVAVEQAGVVL